MRLRVRSNQILLLLTFIFGIAWLWDRPEIHEAKSYASPSPSTMPAMQYVKIVIDHDDAPIYWHMGRPFVEAAVGKEYEISITNPYSVRAAVAVAVDGLNSIDAKHTTPSQAKKWILEPHQTFRVKGWQVSRTRLRHFLFATEPQSYGAKLGSTANLGNISVVYFRERRARDLSKSGLGFGKTSTWPKAGDGSHRQGLALSHQGAGKSNAFGGTGTGSSLGMNSMGSAGGAGRTESMGPLQKSKRPSSLARPSNELAATAQGRSVNESIDFIKINLERQPSMQVSIRYEFHDTLVKLGIIKPSSNQFDDAITRRDKSEGFKTIEFSPELPN